MNVSNQVAEQAVHWLMEMQQGALNPRQHAAWQRWLNAPSVQPRAWVEFQHVNERLRGMPSPLAHAALNAPTSTGRRQALKLLLILGAGSAAAWSLRQQHILPPLSADYRSPVGQRRKVQLADGSQLQLNTGSAVDVHVDGQQRLIRLLEGEIMLSGIAGNAPLHVLTGQGLLTSQAARLNVRQFNDHTQLAVLDGQVEVLPNSYSGLPLTVQASRQVNFIRKGWDTPRPTDANSGAWADGMLVAAHMRLQDFLAELGRYRRGQVNCDPQVADLLISGSYPLDNSERILDLLEVSLPVKVRRFTRYWVTVQARA